MIKQFIRRLLGVNSARIFRRSFLKSGEVDRLSDDWTPAQMTLDSAIRSKIQTIRNRSRQQEQDNDYARRYYQLIGNNVLGSKGISLTVQARRGDELDKSANATIWAAFSDWGRASNCTVTCEQTWRDVQKLVMRRGPADGGILIRKRIGTKFGKFGFQLQLLEIDHLDHNYTCAVDNGNSVVMGIEKNEFGKPVAYHLLDRHPGELIGVRGGHQLRRRVDASEIIHYYVKERPTQSVGIPWLAAPSSRLRHLGEYEFAEVVAARAGASKGGWFESDRGQQFAGEVVTETDGSKSTMNDFSPGSFDELPAGMKFVAYDPKHPTDAFGPFVRSTLLGISAGGGVSYASLTGDLSEANYSSMRAGKLEEQEAFKDWQEHFIEHFCIPIFESWLEAAILSGQIPYMLTDFDRINKPLFRGRRWPWVDPSKDISAAITGIENGLTSRTKIVEEQGGDLEQNFEELADEKQLAAAYDIEIKKESAPVQAVNEEPEKDKSDHKSLNRLHLNGAK